MNERLVSLVLLIGLSHSAHADTRCDKSWIDQDLQPPQILSQAGIFTDTQSLALCDGVVPYWVNSPLWSDGAEKSRWVILPPNAKVQFSEQDPWVFPLGSVFVKHFELETLPGKMQRVETRVSVINRRGQWEGYSYAWNDLGTDATLLSSGLERKLGDHRSWIYPSRAQCLQCHSSWSGSVLGLRTEQLNRTVVGEGEPKNQLEIWAQKGYFTAAIPAPEKWVKYAHLDDPNVPLEKRVRSYLAVNCAHCHQPGSVVRSPMDLRFKIPLASSSTLHQMPYLGDLDLEEPEIIKPGDHSSSILWYRMNTSSTRHMPLIGTTVTDQKAVDLIGEWIDQLPK